MSLRGTAVGMISRSGCKGLLSGTGDDAVRRPQFQQPLHLCRMYCYTVAKSGYLRVILAFSLSAFGVLGATVGWLFPPMRTENRC